MSKERFKEFARSHPELGKAVMKGNGTWQQFYELYEIYGEKNSIWNSYFTDSIADTVGGATTTFKDFVNTFKNLDMDSVQKGINNIQKTIGMLQDIGIGNTKEERNYEAKPIYKRFED